MRNHKYSAPKNKKVTRSLGLDVQQDPLLLFAWLNVGLLGNVSPRASMEMRRMLDAKDGDGT